MKRSLLGESLLHSTIEKKRLVHPQISWDMAIAYRPSAELNFNLQDSTIHACFLMLAASALYDPRVLRTSVQQVRQFFTAEQYDYENALIDTLYFSEIWLHRDRTRALKSLECTLPCFADYGDLNFLAKANFAISYAYLMSHRFDKARHHLYLSEPIYACEQDYGLDLEWRLRDATLNWQENYDIEAVVGFSRIIEEADHRHFPVLSAKAHYRLAQIWKHQAQYEKVLDHTSQANLLFSQLNLPVWLAQTETYFCYVNKYRSNFRQAQKSLDSAYQTYKRFEVDGLAAGTLLDLSGLALSSGQYDTCLHYADEAYLLLKDIDSRYALLALKLKGEAHKALGNYQKAINLLDHVYIQLSQTFFSPYRLAECSLALGQTWIAIGHNQLAQRHLERHIAHYNEKTQLKDATTAQNVLAPAYYDYAFLLMEQNEPHKAMLYAQKAWRLAQQNEMGLLLGRVSTLLGSLYAINGNTNQMALFFRKAIEIFSQIGVRRDLAHTLLAQAKAFTQHNDLAGARESCQEALKLCNNHFHDILWQIYYQLAQITSEPEKAFHLYYQGMQALTETRQNLWQPTLSHAYLAKNTPLRLIEEAVMSCSIHGTTEQFFALVEMSKAQATTMRIIQTNHNQDVSPFFDQLINDRAQITELTKKLEQKPMPPDQLKHVNAQLECKIEHYELLLQQSERWFWAQAQTKPMLTPNAVNSMYETLHKRLGEKWVALSYHVTPDCIFCVSLHANRQVHMKRIDRHAIDISLYELVHFDPHDYEHLEQDWYTVGQSLIPAHVLLDLTPDTTLIIAPHDLLHLLPWQGLRIGSLGKHLVTACVPIVVPSLQMLCQHLGKAPYDAQAKDDGCIIAANGFDGRHTEIAQTLIEAKKIYDIFPDSVLLTAKDEIKKRLVEINLQDYSFLHIASHITHPSEQSPHLSAIALPAEDMLLDELNDIGPLPSLVTLSACGGLLNHLALGDELWGFPVACLAAGADHVIGSLWSLDDQVAVQIMTLFYQNYTQHGRPACALNETIRNLIESDTPIKHWGGFLCYGSP